MQLILTWYLEVNVSSYCRTGNITAMKARSAIGAVAIAAIVAITACSGGEKKAGLTPVDATATHDLLAGVGDALLNVNSVKVALSVEIYNSDTNIFQLRANLNYVAPTALSGYVTLPDGDNRAVRIDDRRIYVYDGKHWLEIRSGLDWHGLRNDTGLVDIGQLVPLFNDVAVSHDGAIETIHADLASFGFNSYIERVVETAAQTGSIPFQANAWEVSLNEGSRLPSAVEITGTTPIGGAGSRFRVHMEFDSYNSDLGTSSTPESATPFTPPRLAAILTPTAGPAKGCAAGISAIVDDTNIGRTYHAGEQLAGSVTYVAPACRNVSAEFIGEYLPGSTRYDAMCRKQCGPGVDGFFDSGQVSLPGTAGIVFIDPIQNPFGKSPDPDRLDDFRLCSIRVTFNDGALGGTFYNVEVGDRDCGHG